MAGAEDAGGDAPLDGRREPEQSDGVGDLRSGPLDPGGQLVLGAAEVGQQLLVRGRLFQRVELSPVQVLQQRVAQQVVVLGPPHDGRDHRQAGGLGGSPAPLAHHQLEPVAAQRPDDDRLQQSYLVDRVDQLGHGVLVEHRARLPRVGRDGLDRQLGEVGALGDGYFCAVCWGCDLAAAGALLDGSDRHAGTWSRSVRWNSSPSPRPRPRLLVLVAIRRPVSRRGGRSPRRPAGKTRHPPSRDGRSAPTARSSAPPRSGPTGGSPWAASPPRSAVRTSSATCAASRVRPSYMVSRTVVSRSRLFSSPLTRLMVRTSCDTPSSA